MGGSIYAAKDLFVPSLYCIFTTSEKSTAHREVFPTETEVLNRVSPAIVTSSSPIEVLIPTAPVPDIKNLLDPSFIWKVLPSVTVTLPENVLIPVALNAATVEIPLVLCILALFPMMWAFKEGTVSEPTFKLALTVVLPRIFTVPPKKALLVIVDVPTT